MMLGEVSRGDCAPLPCLRVVWAWRAAERAVLCILGPVARPGPPIMMVGALGAHSSNTSRRGDSEENEGAGACESTAHQASPVSGPGKGWANTRGDGYTTPLHASILGAIVDLLLS